MASGCGCDQPANTGSNTVGDQNLDGNMEAIRFTGSTKFLEYLELPIPKVSQPDQVLVKVAYSGVCGTDIHIMKGEFPACSQETIIMGHEFNGVVVDVGSHVVHVKKGDEVVVDPNMGCQCCVYCHSGKPHYCEVNATQNVLGVFKDGGWATYCVVPMYVVDKIPESITLQQAALTEPLACISHGWDRLSPIPIGARILVIGAGIIGNLFVCMLHFQGFKKVTVSEPNTDRLNFTKLLDTGFDLLIPDQLKQKRDADPNYGFEIVIDCTGVGSAIQQAFSMLTKGGKLCIFGCASPEVKISVPPFELYAKELTILGTKILPYSMINSMAIIEAMGPRYIDYDKLGIRVFPLNEYKDAMDLLKAGKISKAMFKP